MREVVRNAVADLDAQGITEPGTGAWSTPIVMVRKSSGAWRLCCDYREINKHVRARNNRSLIEVAEEDRPKTSFVTPDRQRQYRRLPFGFASSPAIFQRMVDMLLGGMNDTWQDHFRHLSDLFHALRRANLQLHQGKCAFGAAAVKYLGHIVSREGIRACPSKVKAIAEMPQPTTAKAVQRFQGKCQYYRKFIPNFSASASPLSKAAARQATFAFDDACRKAWDTLRQALMSEPLLAHPDSTRPFYVDCDGSGDGLGAVLAQPNDDGESVVAYASRALLDHGRKWTAIELEATAVIWALETFRPYIDGVELRAHKAHVEAKVVRSRASNIAHVRRSRAPSQTSDVEVILSQISDATDAATVATDVEVVLSRATTQPNSPRASLPPLQQPDPPTLDATAVGTPQPPPPPKQPTRVPATPGPSGSRNVPLPYAAPYHDIRTAQADDPDCQWFRSLMAQPRDQWPRLLASSPLQFTLVYDVLCVRIRGKRPRTILPATLRQQAIHSHHLSYYGGHFGVGKTYARLAARYWCPRMRRDNREFFRRCPLCLATVDPPSKWKWLNLPIGSPFEIVATDLFGPLPATRSGNTHILVLIDHHTRWIELIPMASPTAAAVAEALSSVWISRWGSPRALLSDNGNQFTADLLRQLCTQFGINKVFSAPYHPRGNSIVEAYMRSLKSTLRLCLHCFRRGWDIVLPAAALASRATPHSITKHSPYFLVTGQEVVLPLSRSWSEPSFSLSGERWLHALWRCRLSVLKAHQRIEEANKRTLRSDPHHLAEGMHVALRLTPHERAAAGKSAPAFPGPFIVTRVRPCGLTADIWDPTTGMFSSPSSFRYPALNVRDPWPHLSSPQQQRPFTKKVTIILKLRGTLYVSKLTFRLLGHLPLQQSLTRPVSMEPHQATEIDGPSDTLGMGTEGRQTENRSLTSTSNPPKRTERTAEALPALARPAAEYSGPLRHREDSRLVPGHFHPTDARRVAEAKRILSNPQSQAEPVHKELIYLHRRHKAYRALRVELWRLGTRRSRLGKSQRRETPPPQVLQAMRGPLEGFLL
ncbi:hypothetical protein Emed_000084 [Eimeria media]